MMIDMGIHASAANEDKCNIWIEKSGYAIYIHIREKNKDTRVVIFKNEAEQIVNYLNDCIKGMDI